MYFWKLVWEKYTGSVEAGVLVSRPGPDLMRLGGSSGRGKAGGLV